MRPDWFIVDDELIINLNDVTALYMDDDDDWLLCLRDESNVDIVVSDNAAKRIFNEISRRLSELPLR